MKKISLLLILGSLMGMNTACDKIEAMMKMPEKMDDLGQSTKGMSNKMDETNGFVAKQALLTAVVEFAKKDNFDKVVPVPTGLLAPASVFAQVASDTELVEFIKVQLSYINKIAPAERVDSSGKVRALTNEEQMDILMQKFVALQAIKAVSAFIPDGTDEAFELAGNGTRVRKNTLYKIVLRVSERSEFQRVALAILAMRADFLSEVLLKQSALDTEEAGFDTVGDAMKAVRYQEKIDYLLSLPFRSQIKASTTGLMGSENYNGDIKNMDISLDDQTAKKMGMVWKDIRQKTEYAMKIPQHNWTGNENQDRENYLKDLAAFEKIAAKAQEKEADYSKK
jgi:hypothetical protein